MIINVYISDNEILKHMRQKLIEIQGETYTYIISTSLSQYFIEQVDNDIRKVTIVSKQIEKNECSHLIAQLQIYVYSMQTTIIICNILNMGISFSILLFLFRLLDIV